jgi:hypothetical protein
VSLAESLPVMGDVHDPAMSPQQLSTGCSTSAVATRHSLVRLQREWNRLRVTPQAVATARGWRLRVERLDSLDDVLGAAGFGHTDRSADCDDDLVRELLLIARVDPLAARVLLQRLLPGLGSIARRRLRRGGDPMATIDDLLAAAWTVICTFPVERRPTFLVAGLLRDAEYHAFRRGQRRRADIVAVAPERFDQSAAPAPTATAADELGELLAEAAQAGLADDDLALARRLAAGATSAELAAEARVTDRTIRNHRTAMLYRLRAFAMAPT